MNCLCPISLYNVHVAPCPSGRSCRQIVGLLHQLRGIPSFAVTVTVAVPAIKVPRTRALPRYCGSVDPSLRGPPSLPHPPRMLLPSISAQPLVIQKKNVFGIPQYRFGLEKPKQLRSSVRFALPNRSPKSIPRTIPSINLVSISRCSSSTTNPVCVRRVNSLLVS